MEPVDLDNCDREPIHTPGSIQPHGALVAFDATHGTPVLWSENASALLGCTIAPESGPRLAELLGTDEVALLEAIAAGESDLRSLSPVPVTFGGRDFECVLHRHEQLVIMELEPLGATSAFDARTVHFQVRRSVARLRQATTLRDLWDLTADAVRAMTGYDRVMVYRFDADQHGEVVAESRDTGVVQNSFLGLHYPASDIPAQARRLYLQNPVRIIVDVGYRPCPLQPSLVPDEGTPLDMSHAVLRSVSPIHLEYLSNMGVRGSMSLSLVVDGQLWGLVACHHYQGPYLVPYSVRTSCELLTQALSWQIGALEREQAAYERSGAEQRVARLLQRASISHDLGQALVGASEDLLEVAGASGVVVSVDGHLRSAGSVPEESQIRSLVAWWVGEHEPEVFVEDRLERRYPAAAEFAAIGSGLLALGFPATEGNFILWFRPSVERTVSWGGDPRKPAQWGPHGDRLSPRGSFDLWREHVRDQSRPFEPHRLQAATALRNELSQLMYKRALEADKTRNMFMSILGHDLRNPLGALMMSAELLNRAPSTEVTDRVSARIKSSGDRMQRMIDQLLDLSRIRASNGTMPIARRTFDLCALVVDLVREIELARPGRPVEIRMCGDCELDADLDRIAQVIGNLLSNARHHGVPEGPITVELRSGPAEVVLAVTNQGRPIPEGLRPHLFEPYRSGNGRGQGPGLGLGLFITHSIVAAHDGRIEVVSDEGGTTFSVHLPR